MFIAIVFSTNVLPIAVSVAVTTNSMPTGFQVTVFSMTRFPVAMTFTRMPARPLAALQQ